MKLKAILINAVRGSSLPIITAIVSIGCAVIASTAMAARPARYAVIEIGAKGVKAHSFDLDRAAHDCACARSGDAYLECIDPQTFGSINVNPIEDPDFKATTKAVQQLAGELITRHEVPAEHVHVVISSSVASNEDRADQLIGRLKANRPLRLTHPVDKVTADEEAAYALRGVLGMLPDDIRKLRTKQATLIDIGSGNIKGAYANTDGKSELTFDVAYGTKVAASAIDKLRGPDSFGAAAAQWRASVFVPALRAELERKQGVTNRNRVYLIGGIVWALATMTHPEDKVSKYPPLDPKSIDQMIAKAAAPDSQLCSDQRKKTYPEVGKVCDTFSLNQMVAGFQLLKGLSEELRFVESQKNIFFFRNSQYAWPLGYVSGKAGTTTKG